MINKVVLVGRLTRDPELRKTQTNKSVVSFTIAVNRRFQTNGQSQADFISCVAWNNSAEFMAKYLKKGNLVGVEGSIQTRNYDDAKGNKVYVTEVLCDNIQGLESRGSNNTNNYQNNDANNQFINDEPTDFSSSNQFEGNTLDISSDDLPF